MAATPNSVSSPTPNYQASYQVVSVSWTPSAVSTITAPQQTLTVPGVRAAIAASAGMPAQQRDVIVSCAPPSHVAGVGVCSAIVTADNTVGVQFVNPTAGSVTPASGTWQFVIMRQPTAKGSFDG